MALQPRDLYAALRKQVFGQDEALSYVSVAIFKHLCGDSVGNLLIIGNSGTGKTSIMRAIERLYAANPTFEKYRVVVRMNANTLASEEGAVITGRQLMRTLQDRAQQLLGKEATPETIQRLMEHATVCVDEVDKISATVGSRPNPTGIHLQQSLLTLMEDEKVSFETRWLQGNEYRPVQLEIDTSRLLFICAGAFEELYDQVYARLIEEGGQDRLSQIVSDVDGNVEFAHVFRLSENLLQEDLFRYGVMPQFLSRFDTTLVLKELPPDVLESIFAGGADSLYERSKAFFKRFDVELDLTDEARRLIAEQASLQTRVGARALKDVYSRVIKPFEFDPYDGGLAQKLAEGTGHRLTLTGDVVRERLGLRDKRQLGDLL